MEAQQLRLGNYVTYSDVVDVVSAVYLYTINTIQFSSILVNEVEPIPLTEQWLLDFGFILPYRSSVYRLELNYKDEEGNLLEEDFPTTLQHWAGTDKVSICRSGITAFSSVCNYVHQLQNLYFALTGEELTLKNK